MSQKNMSQIIVYKNQEELRSDIEEMIKEVEDIKKRIKIKQNEYEELFYNLNIDSARSVTASARRGMPGSYDISEKAKKDLSELHTDIKNMKNEAAAIRMSIKEKENDLRNVKKKDRELQFNSAMKPKYTNIEDTFININDTININALLLDARRASSAKSSPASGSSSAKSSSAPGSSSAKSSSAPGSSSAKSSSVSRASSSAAKRASPPAAARTSSPSSKTGGLRKRRGKNLDNTKTRK
jgi:Holliday junction resolvasome RuvABC endonuclease subunit